jgi:hypothetical protein
MFISLYLLGKTHLVYAFFFFAHNNEERRHYTNHKIKSEGQF